MLPSRFGGQHVLQLGSRRQGTSQSACDSVYSALAHMLTVVCATGLLYCFRPWHESGPGAHDRNLFCGRVPEASHVRYSGRQQVRRVQLVAPSLVFASLFQPVCTRSHSHASAATKSKPTWTRRTESDVSCDAHHPRNLQLQLHRHCQRRAPAEHRRRHEILIFLKTNRDVEGLIGTVTALSSSA